MSRAFAQEFAAVEGEVLFEFPPLQRFLSDLYCDGFSSGVVSAGICQLAVGFQNKLQSFPKVAARLTESTALSIDPWYFLHISDGPAAALSDYGGKLSLHSSSKNEV
jgi:hypothetical protein